MRRGSRLTGSDVVGLRGVGDTIVVAQKDTLRSKRLKGWAGQSRGDVGVLQPHRDESIIRWISLSTLIRITEDRSSPFPGTTGASGRDPLLCPT